MIYNLLEVLYRTVVVIKNNECLYKELPYTSAEYEVHWKERKQTFRTQNTAAICSLFALNLSVGEYLLLRIIAMFNNIIQLSPVGQEIALRAREKYTVMLVELVRTRVSPETTLDRVTKMLGLLKGAVEYSKYGNAAHAKMVVNNYDNMCGQLTEEIHVVGSIYEKKS